jgi:transposase
MNIHKNARLTFPRRLERVHAIVQGSMRLTAAAASYGLSVRTVRKWLGRYKVQGDRAVLACAKRR